MSDTQSGTVNRRDLILRTVPVCAAACAGLCLPEGVSATYCSSILQDQHKFDVPRETTVTSRQQRRQRWSHALFYMAMLRRELGEQETIRLLTRFSEVAGTQIGTQAARSAPGTSFEHFVERFRPPEMADQITQEIVEDTPKAFGMRVTECVHAEVFREARMDGDIGHAAVCSRDFSAAVAFNSHFRLERTKTLMQGDDHCNHRYVDLS